MSEQLPAESQGKLIVFGGKQIRRAWHEGEWYFSVVDIVGALTESPNPRNYWNMMKAREKKGSGLELSTLCVQLKLTSADGKSYRTDAVNTENAFRIIQSIPSPKAEPFKRWLAEVGYERVQEIENPELAQQRMRELYKAKGYPDDWIEKRMTRKWWDSGFAGFTLDSARLKRNTLSRRPAGPLPQGMPNPGGFFFARGERS